MSDRKDKAFVRHSIDTGLESMQGNPFLAQRILNQERTEQPVMKKKISFAFILAMILLLAFAATAIAGSVNEDFNAWLYRIWPEAATTLMPVNMSCENNGIRLEIISAVADGEELYITYSMEDLVKDRLNTECSPVMYVDDARSYDWESSFEQPIRDEATGKIIFGEHFTYNGYITGSVPADTQVINPAYSREIRLADTVFLSGIGMVDGRLHVQLHFVDHQKRTIGEYLDTVSYRPDETEVLLRDKDSETWYDEKYQDPDMLPEGISAVGWGSQPDDPDTPEWAEIIFSADAAGLSADSQELFAEIRDIIPIVGTWNVEIPVRLIGRTLHLFGKKDFQKTPGVQLVCR